MAMEPITLFAGSADIAAVARRLRELVPTVEIDGPDDGWSKATVHFGKGKKRRTLTLTHDPDYYAEPNWSTQMSGMRGYFARFLDSDRKPTVLTLTTSFRFSLATLFKPDFDPDGDERLDILFAVTQTLDGVLFTPSSLRDARGRILFSADGPDAEDPAAVWPRVVGEVSVAAPAGAAMHEKSRPRRPDDDAAAQGPSPERVARRALALTALTARAVLEQEKAKSDARTVYRNLLAWIVDIGVDGEMEPEESEVLQRALGKLDEQMHVDALWRLEGLAVLAWSLGRFELPPHDQLVDVNVLWERLDLLDADAAKTLLSKPSLRPRHEIAALRNRLIALHWRLRNYHLNPGVMDFADYARTCWFGPLDIAGVPLVGGDLALRGTRIDRATAEVFETTHSAAQERHLAANWLWEGPERYSHASVAT